MKHIEFKFHIWPSATFFSSSLFRPFVHVSSPSSFLSHKSHLSTSSAYSFLFPWFFSLPSPFLYLCSFSSRLWHCALCVSFYLSPSSRSACHAIVRFSSLPDINDTHEERCILLVSRALGHWNYSLGSRVRSPSRSRFIDFICRISCLSIESVIWFPQLDLNIFFSLCVR